MQHFHPQPVPDELSGWSILRVSFEFPPIKCRERRPDWNVAALSSLASLDALRLKRSTRSSARGLVCVESPFSLYFCFFPVRHCNSPFLPLMTIGPTPLLSPSAPYHTPVHFTVEALSLPYGASDSQRAWWHRGNPHKNTSTGRLYDVSSFTVLEKNKIVLSVPIRRVFHRKNDKESRWLWQRS